MDMSNIEDDVKRCNELIKVEHANWIGISNQLAISRILSDYTRQKQINEEHQRINGELREKVKELEEIVNCYNIVKNETLSNDIVVMLKGDFIRNYEQIYIPKQVVIEKINKINKAYEDSKDENGESPYYYPDYTVRVLQEFLGGESK